MSWPGRSWRTRWVKQNSRLFGSIRPPDQARIPRRQDHLRWRLAPLSGARRRPRVGRPRRRGADRPPHRQERTAWHDGVVPPVRVRSPWWLRRRERRRPSGARSCHALDRWRQRRQRAGGVDQPDGRFETELLATDENLAALSDLGGSWIDRVHDRRPPKTIILDMDSSVSPTYGEQEGSAWNGHFLHLLPSAVRVQPIRRSGA